MGGCLRKASSRASISEQDFQHSIGSSLQTSEHQSLSSANDSITLRAVQIPTRPRLSIVVSEKLIPVDRLIDKLIPSVSRRNLKEVLSGRNYYSPRRQRLRGSMHRTEQNILENYGLRNRRLSQELSMNVWSTPHLKEFKCAICGAKSKVSLSSLSAIWPILLHETHLFLCEKKECCISEHSANVIENVLSSRDFVISWEQNFIQRTEWTIFVDKDMEMLDELLSLIFNSSKIFQFNIYECIEFSFERTGISDDKDNESHDLNIGLKILRKRSDLAEGCFRSTTLGVFFSIKDKDGKEQVCAFTNAEGSNIGSPCFVESQTHKMSKCTLLAIGTPFIMVEGTKKVKVGENSPSYDVYLDGMLILLENNLSTHSIIKHLDTSANLQLVIPNHPLHEHLAKVNFNTPFIKRLNTNSLDSQPSGVIRSIKHGFYDKSSNLRVSGALKITRDVHINEAISYPGDCGTLICSVPQECDKEVYVYASIFGKCSAKIRCNDGEIKEESFTVAYPIQEFLDVVQNVLRESTKMYQISIQSEGPVEIVDDEINTKSRCQCQGACNCCQGNCEASYIKSNKPLQESELLKNQNYVTML